ncbi:MAG: pilus assembly protein N-terminal domain-containing protein, partial [Maioricimonas sp. JB049]
PLDSRLAAMPTSEEKLEVIHHRSQLIIARQNIRRIAISDPSVIEVAQYTPTEISVLGLGLGTTDMTIWFEGSDDPLIYLVTVIRDPALEEQRRIDYGRIERKLALLYPNSKVYLIPMSRKIIVRGQARDSEEAARIMQIVRGEVLTEEGDYFDRGNDYSNIYLAAAGRGGRGGASGNDFISSLIVNELQVPGEFQVSIRVRVAEVNRSQLRRMGIDWTVLFNQGRHFIGQTFAAANPVLTGIFENGEIEVLVDALASNGSARILEDANLVVLSGEPAAFLAGGEFAVPSTVGLNGVGVGTTTFRGFGTSIIATPTVVDNDLVRMQITPEVSAINSGNSVQGIPGVDVRRVQTRVELREGQTIVLGGLFSRREQAEVTRIPFLGEIPVIGAYLFNAKQATEDETELLIVVTPEIYRPMDPEEVPPLPGQPYPHPDDIDFYKLNRIEGNPDLGHYQLLPYGNGQGFAHDVGYNFYNPAPVDPRNIEPAPTQAYEGTQLPGGPLEPGLPPQGQQTPYGRYPGMQPQPPAGQYPPLRHVVPEGQPTPMYQQPRLGPPSAVPPATPDPGQPSGLPPQPTAGAAGGPYQTQRHQLPQRAVRQTGAVVTPDGHRPATVTRPVQW